MGPWGHLIQYPMQTGLFLTKLPMSIPIGFQSPSPLPVLPVSSGLWLTSQSAVHHHLPYLDPGLCQQHTPRLQHHISLTVHHLVSGTFLTIHIKLLQTHLHAQLLSALFGLGVQDLVFISNTLLWVDSAQPTADYLDMWILSSSICTIPPNSVFHKLDKCIFSSSTKSLMKTLSCTRLKTEHW